MRNGIVAVAGAALLVAAWAGADEKGSLRAIGEGRALYLTNCASCHGVDLRGATAPDLTRIVGKDGRFTRLHAANHVEGRLDGTMGGSMPYWGTALQDRWPYGRPAALLAIHKVTAYLESAQADTSRAVAQAPLPAR
jgi:mono/diheme cytochrome c family protein